ncbi:hypothetical protein ACNF49_31590 [Actinomadura sp. ATCC 39365]
MSGLHSTDACPEARRVRDFRRLIALGWFLQLGPGGPATPHNPPGALAVQAARVLWLLR